MNYAHATEFYYPEPHTLGAHERPSSLAPRDLYFALMQDDADGVTTRGALQERSVAFLQQCLKESAALPCDLPPQPSALEAWMEHHTAQVLADYQVYLQGRTAGSPRQYFATKAHALHFLTAVAPTKTVDGAWLAGLLPHWQDDRFTALIRIYLEELGCGRPDQNHVVLYKRLLVANGCDRWEHLDDHHFIQGAIQLALARNAERFLPEVIGFNLGYEQLPLHLLICAFELNELGIDPTYFGLHVTVDNADTGHARQALQGLRDSLPVAGDRQAFYRRVIDGYRLNDLGASTGSVIAGFDLEQELISVMTRKSVAGKQAHADYCRIGGRTVNDWLADPAQIPGFVAALQDSGWIKRGQPPQNSRFWKLIAGERADMFGVFSPYEQQVLHDWIESTPARPASADPCASVVDVAVPVARPIPRSLSFKTRQRLLDNLDRHQPGTAARGPAPDAVQRVERRAMVRPGPFSLQRHDGDSGDDGDDANEFSAELRALTVQLAQAPDRRATMQVLTGLMSPTRHHTAAGLQATRIFARLFGVAGTANQ